MFMPQKKDNTGKLKLKAKEVPVPRSDNSLAVIEFSGKQHLVKVGDVLEVDNQSEAVGKNIEVEKVLLLEKNGQVTVGKPHVAGAKVVLEVLGDYKGEKIEVMKYKAKSRYRKHIGYRSKLTRVKVLSIDF